MKLPATALELQFLTNSDALAVHANGAVRPFDMSEPGWKRFAATLGNTTAVAVVNAGNASLLMRPNCAASVSFKALRRKKDLILRARGVGRVTRYFRWTFQSRGGGTVVVSTRSADVLRLSHVSSDASGKRRLVRRPSNMPADPKNQSVEDA
jgi:hypothetical protein